MQNIIKPTDIAIIEGEPRINDLVLGAILGFDRPRDIRQIIERNALELAEYGVCDTAPQTPGALGGRPAKVYQLNEPQALLICTLSRTPFAARVRKELISAFMEAKGRPVSVKAHRRRLPRNIAAMAERLDSDYQPGRFYEGFLRFFVTFKDQPEALAEWADKMAGDLELSLTQFCGFPLRVEDQAALMQRERARLR